MSNTPQAIYPVDFDIPHANGLSYLAYYPDQKVYHTGWDLNKGIGNQDLGNEVRAPFDCVVEFVTPAPTIMNRQNRGWGWMIVLYSAKFGVWSRHAHMQDEPLVKVGEKLTLGQPIGKVGKTGTRSAHHHWDMWRKELQDFAQGDFYFYPVGYAKKFVQEHYIDCLAFVEEVNQPPRWEDQELEWAGKYIKNIQLLKTGYVPSIVALIRRVHESMKASRAFQKRYKAHSGATKDP